MQSGGDRGRDISLYPNAAFQDSSGDKPSNLDYVDTYDVISYLAIYLWSGRAAIYLAWIFAGIGKTSIHTGVMAFLTSVGVLLPVFAVVSLFDRGKTIPVKFEKRTRWKLFCAIGFLGSIGLHYLDQAR